MILAGGDCAQGAPVILCACSRARCARWQVAELSTAGTKMLVSNLGPEVTDEDLKELFVEHGGPIKKAEIFYKQDGTSSGQGEVVFKKRADADKAIKTLNNVPLDGKPLQLALVGVSSAAAPQPARGAGATTYGSLSAFPPLPLCIPLATSTSLPVCMRTREVALKLCLRNRTMTLASQHVLLLFSRCHLCVPALLPHSLSCVSRLLARVNSILWV